MDLQHATLEEGARNDTGPTSHRTSFKLRASNKSRVRWILARSQIIAQVNKVCVRLIERSCGFSSGKHWQQQSSRFNGLHSGT